MTDSADTEPMALAGLRRLVLHARDKLAAATLNRPSSTFLHEPKGLYYTDAVIAKALAVEVLTLVADCLPAPESDAAALAAENQELRAAVATLTEQRNQLISQLTAAEKVEQPTP